MSADALIGRLDAVRRMGDRRWMARCPVHGGCWPALSIRQFGDGTVLIRCFEGCCPADILAAVGLELRDLFPAVRIGQGHEVFMEGG